MRSDLADWLPALICEHFPADMARQAGYDHSYTFISTVIPDHVA